MHSHRSTQFTEYRQNDITLAVYYVMTVGRLLSLMIMLQLLDLYNSYRNLPHRAHEVYNKNYALYENQHSYSCKNLGPIEFVTVKEQNC